MAVEMIPQIEHPRETGPREPGFIPGSIQPLSLDQIAQSMLNFRAPGFARIDQPHQRPGGLRSCAGPPGLKSVGIVIGCAGFTPSAVPVLNALKPVGRPIEHSAADVLANSRQAAQALPCAIDVIDAPAPEPRPVRLLLPSKVPDRLPNPRVIPADTEIAHHLKRACRYVGRGGI